MPWPWSRREHGHGVDIIKHNVVLRQVALVVISLTSVLRDSYSQHAQI